MISLQPGGDNRTSQSAAPNNNPNQSPTPPNPGGNSRGNLPPNTIPRESLQAFCPGVTIENQTDKKIKAILYDSNDKLEWIPLGGWTKPAMIKIGPREEGRIEMPAGHVTAKLKLFYPKGIDVPTQVYYWIFNHKLGINDVPISSSTIVTGGQKFTFTGSSVIPASSSTILGAAGAGALAGALIIGGPVTMLIGAGAAGYAATRKDQVGAVAQTVGRSTSVVTSSAVSTGKDVKKWVEGKSSQGSSGSRNSVDGGSRNSSTQQYPAAGGTQQDVLNYNNTSSDNTQYDNNNNNKVYSGSSGLNWSSLNAAATVASSAAGAIFSDLGKTSSKSSTNNNNSSGLQSQGQQHQQQQQLQPNSSRPSAPGTISLA